jgi:hypothetical protein
VTTAPSNDLLIFDKPAKYKICVLGQISDFWVDRMEGMSIQRETSSGRLPICSLEGELLDQAALLGVLNWLFELHLPLLSVVCLSHPHEANMNR